MEKWNGAKEKLDTNSRALPNPVYLVVVPLRIASEERGLEHRTSGANTIN